MELVIRRNERPRLDLGEVWKYRELLYFLAWRDFKVRYKQTAIGASWALFQPLITMIVFTIFFNRMLGVESPGGNYPVFAFVGLIYWNFFSVSFLNASNSMVKDQPLITKVYFPRVIAPLATVFVSVVDFAFAAVVLAGLMIVYGISPGPLGLVLALPMLVVSFLFSSGMGMFFAAVNVRYRDVQYVLPFLVQTLLFVTPVIYAVSFVPTRYQTLMYANPMTGVISVMRAELVHQGSVSWSGVALSIAVALAAAFVGVRYFIRSERRFADIV